MTLDELLDHLMVLREQGVPLDTKVLVRAHGQDEEVDMVMNSTVITGKDSRIHTVYIYGAN